MAVSKSEELDVADYSKDTDFGIGGEKTDVDRMRTDDGTDVDKLTERIQVGAGQQPAQGKGAPEIKTVVLALYDAFGRGDRAAFEALITGDFTFTSPYDDAIDRAEFFERCWPNHEQMSQLAVERVAVDGGGAFVTYTVHFRDGHRSENTEWLQLRDGKVASVDVYFGASHADGKARDPYERRTPGREVDQLSPILGTWKITGEASGTAIEGEQTYERMRGDFFIHGQWGHRFADGTEHTGVSILGNEPERGSIMCENFDNLGYAREYRVSIAGNTWKLEGAHERATYTFQGNALTIVWEMSKDGRTWSPLCTLRGVR